MTTFRKATRIEHIARLQRRLEGYGFILIHDDEFNWYYMYRGKKDKHLFEFRKDLLNHLKGVCRTLSLNLQSRPTNPIRYESTNQ